MLLLKTSYMVKFPLCSNNNCKRYVSYYGTYQLYPASFPGLPHFMFFGLCSVWYTEKERQKKIPARHGNTYHINYIWWWQGGHSGCIRAFNVFLVLFCFHVLYWTQPKNRKWGWPGKRVFPQYLPIKTALSCVAHSLFWRIHSRLCQNFRHMHSA